MDPENLHRLIQAGLDDELSPQEREVLQAELDRRPAALELRQKLARGVELFRALEGPAAGTQLSPGFAAQVAARAMAARKPIAGLRQKLLAVAAAVLLTTMAALWAAFFSGALDRTKAVAGTGPTTYRRSALQVTIDKDKFELKSADANGRHGVDLKL